VPNDAQINEMDDSIRDRLIEVDGRFLIGHRCCIWCLVVIVECRARTSRSLADVVLDRWPCFGRPIFPIPWPRRVDVWSFDVDEQCLGRPRLC